MANIISVIIPHYNQISTLPDTLDSILKQKIEGLDVIIIDDCSTEHCQNIVDNYCNKGLNINLLRNNERLFLKDTIIKGIKAAKSDFITFVDADDWIYGNSTFAYLLQRMEIEKADILHFSTYSYDSQQNGLIGELTFSKPYTESLSGDALFSLFCANSLPGHNLWGKIYTKNILDKCLSVADRIKVHHYCADLFLYTIIAFHSQKYVGINLPAYVYRVHKDHDLWSTRKSLGRVVTLHQMERFLLPYFAALGCPLEQLRALEHYIVLFQKENISAYCSYIQSKRRRRFDIDDLRFLLETSTAESYLEILLLNGLISPQLSTQNGGDANLQDLLDKNKQLSKRVKPFKKMIKLFKNVGIYFYKFLKNKK